MNSFEQARGVEAKALTHLLPFIEERSDRFVVTDKGRLAPLLQEVAGDVIMNRDGRMWTLEIKSEGKHTGNLFLETWSNRNLDDLASHALRGSKTGWMYSSRADVLFYYFLDTDFLYMMSLPTLQRWAFGYRGRDPRLFDFPEKPQGKYVQMNDTHGRLVPVKALMAEMVPTPRRVTVSQLEFLLEAAE